MDANVNQSEVQGFTARSFRDALGCYATGIAVATTATGEHGPVGLTVNSFTSVSLDPPLVLWCLDRDCDAYDAYATADHYAINVLGAEQEDLSVRFATRENHVIESGEFKTWVTGAPILEETIAQFDCKVTARLDGGDHVILIGEVQKIASRPGEPLVFNRGKYRTLSPK